MNLLWLSLHGRLKGTQKLIALTKCTIYCCYYSTRKELELATNLGKKLNNI